MMNKTFLKENKWLICREINNKNNNNDNFDEDSDGKNNISKWIYKKCNFHLVEENLINL